MIEKEFIPYQEALELKELRFDEPCFGYWNIDPGLPTKYLNPRCEPFKHDWCLPAPTFAQAFRLFREKYGLKSWIQEHTADTFIYEIRPHKLTDYKEGEVYVYEVYEEAELECLRKLIEIVKDKQQ